MEKETKYFTKLLLIEYNNAAIREKRNRAIKEEFLESLNDEYIFPIIFHMYHSKDEIRVQVSFFEFGTGFLDMTLERYDMLPIAIWDEKEQKMQFETEDEIRSRFPYKNREWTDIVVKRPYRKQDKFRKDVLKAYDSRCAVCGIQEPKILRAAHIVPVAEGGSDEISNGICLCTNHEIAFDNGLLKIRPNGSIEVTSQDLKEVFDRIVYPNNKEEYPNEKYLQMKYDNDFE